MFPSRLTSFCKNVTLSGDTSGSLLIGQRDVYFVADEAICDPRNAELLLRSSDVLFVTLAYDEIKGFSKRWYQLQDNAMEVFLITGQTSLFSFADAKVGAAMQYVALHWLISVVVQFLSYLQEIC